jgi:hypothetical protein
MSFSVQNFKAQLKSKGIMKPWAYSVIVSPPTGGGRELQIATESISLPGAAFLSADNYRPYGNGKNYDIPYSMNTTEIECSHIIDGSADLIKIFYDWANKVSSMNDKGRKFAASYFEEYAVPMKIKIYREDGSIAKTMELFEVYPKSVNQTSMSWGTTDDFTRLSVSYFFTYYEIIEGRTNGFEGDINTPLDFSAFPDGSFTGQTIA